MKIQKMICSAGKTGFYFDDQKAIKQGAGHDGFNYVGEAVTPGFTSIRQAGESISVQIQLEDGEWAFGDCAAVQYSGAGGRDPLFLAADYIPLIESVVIPHFIGKELNSFKELAAELEALRVDGKALHTAIRYGVSQALLDAVAKVLHIDCYGTIGMVFGDDNFPAMADYLATLEEAANPFHLRIEGPMDAGSREAQIRCLAGLRKELDARQIHVEIVADEWCNTWEDIKLFADEKAGHMIQIKTPDLGGVNNTIEAVLYCKKVGIGAYQGGTCNETDRSAQVCTDIALATQPDQILAKPGMGVDEGYMIVNNEMQRVLARLAAK